MGGPLYQDYPWRNTSNPFHALTAEIFLQRTKAKQVTPVYKEFSINYKKPQDVLDDSRDNYMTILSKLGLKWRIPLFKRLCEELVEHHHGKVPDNKAELVNLSGVGDYAASAFLSFHRNNPYPLIDANTVRFVSRYFGIKRTPESRRNKEFIKISSALLPNRYSGRFNYCLLDFAMQICKNNPQCDRCLLKRKCKYYIGRD